MAILVTMSEYNNALFLNIRQVNTLRPMKIKRKNTLKTCNETIKKSAPDKLSDISRKRENKTPLIH